MATLPDLLALLTQSIDSLTSLYASAGHPLPSLDAPFEPKTPAEEFRLSSPGVMDATRQIVAAAGQIIASVRDPVIGVMLTAHSFNVPACLRVASELNVTEILREAGEEGVAAEMIAAYSGVDPGLLERVLRLLATHHIYREVAPGVFANNRISSALDKGKSVKDLVDKPNERFSEERSGPAAHVELLADECFRCASVLSDTMKELPTTGTPTIPLLRAFDLPPTSNLFSFLETSPARLARFSMAMHGSVTSNKFQDGFPWGNLVNGNGNGQASDRKVVVDVGAGVGAYMLSVARELVRMGGVDKVEFVVQDREKTVEKARKHWEEHMPDAVEKGLVKFEPQDFFEDQPSRPTPVSVFVLRHILHNWSDAKSLQILRALQAAASPETELLIIDRVVRPASPAESTDLEALRDIPGAAMVPAPAPLLPNWGIAGEAMYHYDLTMHNLLGATERTVDGFVALLRQAGWQLVRIYRDPQGAQSSNLVARPSPT
ncbi:S-adenosyl-L-methionine-dependent methyltransferase [Mycena amicta]|nr:S-adenosyl-L-methionine-dependent methyltransferase [Mycena amicta]